MAAPRKAFPLRLRTDVHAALERWARDDFRSVNGQIEFLVMDALRRAGRLPADAERGGGERSAHASSEHPV
jgi:hypothetical protein